MAALVAVVEAAAASAALAVTQRRMFGCQAFFADGRIFAVVTPDERIGLKLPERSALPGGTPWSPNGQATKAWALVPVTMHARRVALAKWLAVAHAAAAARR